jgi:phthiocerol/phenolphthiocerol synthesis type-I polyketide synthase E
MAVCSNITETTFSDNISEIQDRPAVFMFPGQGAQYINMGLNLYETEPLFRSEMDLCFDLLKSLTPYDIKKLLYPPPGEQKPDSNDIINQTDITQPVIFIIEYALARLLMAWGIKPHAMIGHSIGEYVAAHLAGVFSLADALKLVVFRGKLMQQIPTGAMLSVPLPETKLRALLSENKDIAVAAVNTPSQCVLSGPHEAINAFAKKLQENGHETRLLHTSHAFHSPMMEPVMAEFKQSFQSITTNAPLIPYISHVSGTWISVEEATDPDYWARHLRETVHFSAGAGELLKLENAVFIEIGLALALWKSH